MHECLDLPPVDVGEVEAQSQPALRSHVGGDEEPDRICPDQGLVYATLRLARQPDDAVTVVVIEVVAEPLGLVEEAQVLVARHGGVGEREHDLAESGFPASDRSSIDERLVIHGAVIHGRILASREPDRALRCKWGMRKLLVGLGLVVTLLAILSSTALAGGWAVSTLDPMDPPVAGQETEVGFTIRQHGVTPVELEDVAVAITGPSGAIAVFDAQQDGTTGHYVATVVFEAGQSTWEIRQGWFEAQQLGVIDVGATGPPEAPVAVESSSYRWPSAARALLPVAAIVLAGVAIADAVSSRRRNVSARQ